MALSQKQKSKTVGTHKYAEFIICNSCYWCASVLLHYGLPRCPSCNSKMIELIPISQNEFYRLNVDKQSIEFWNAKT
jgi:hypothetical protein